VEGEENVPQEAALQPGPVTLQFRFPPSLEVAVSERVCVVVRPARLGEMETVPDGPELITIERDPLWFESAGELESETEKVRPDDVPAAAGVPVMDPEVESERPVGSVPPVCDHL